MIKQHGSVPIHSAHSDSYVETQGQVLVGLKSFVFQMSKTSIDVDTINLNILSFLELMV